MIAALELASRIAARVARIEGVAAVALGGSLARGTADENSDIDLGIYYHRERPFAVQSLGRLAAELDDRKLSNLVTPLGEWGPWINGGGWLVIDGRHLDFLYRDLERVSEVIAQCRAGRPTVDYQIGHPAGFHSHIYMGEVHLCRPLCDPLGELAALKVRTAEYPAPMRQYLIDKYLFEARFSLEIARKPAGRGDAYYVSGCLFRAVGCLVQVLFALNRQYFVNEKGSVRAVELFSVRPAGFAATVNAIFSQRGAGGDELQRALDRLEQLRAAVEQLCAGSP